MACTYLKGSMQDRSIGYLIMHTPGHPRSFIIRIVPRTRDGQIDDDEPPETSLFGHASTKKGADAPENLIRCAEK